MSETFYGLDAGDLADFIGEPITDPVDVKRAGWCLRMAAGLVEDVLEGAVFDHDKVPVRVQNVVIACASRGYTNPGNYATESVDDWSGANAPIREMGFYLTATERAALGEYVAKSRAQFGAVSRVRGDLSAPVDGLVPVDYAGDQFPWYGGDW